MNWKGVMMPYSSCLDHEEGRIVLDTSVVINLLATNIAGDILQALPHAPLVTQTAHDELLRGTQLRGYDTSQNLQRLVGDGVVELVDLGPEAKTTFLISYLVQPSIHWMTEKLRPLLMPMTRHPGLSLTSGKRGAYARTPFRASGLHQQLMFLRTPRSRRHCRRLHSQMPSTGRSSMRACV